MVDLNRIAILIVAVALVSVMGISDGGTVTLTGTCTSAILTPSSNSITFSISNSGNDSAVGVSVTPVFPGMSVAATGSSQTLLPPGGILSYLFESSGMPENGSYAGHFYVTYDQGQSQFHAIFPCMVDIGGIATSDITVSSVKQLQNGSIVVAVDNSGNASLENVSISSYAPEPLVITPHSLSVSLAPGTSTVVFSMPDKPPEGASYVSDFAVSYAFNGVHYASVYTYSIGASTASGNGISAYLIKNIVWLLLAVTIAALLVLIAASLLAKRGEAD